MQRRHISEAAEGKQRSLLPLGRLCMRVESLAGFWWNFVKAEEMECVCLHMCVCASGGGGICFLFYLVIFWLHWALVAAYSSLWHEGSFSCSMWDLVPWPGIEPWPLALGAQSLSHWATGGSLRDGGICDGTLSRGLEAWEQAGLFCQRLCRKSWQDRAEVKTFTSSFLLLFFEKKLSLL